MSDYYPKVGVCYDHAERTKLYMIYTFRCNAHCDHCLVESGPRRKEKLTPEEAEAIVRAAADAGKSFLVISGGEPLLYRDEIVALARLATGLGFYVCLNTNGFWARTPERALEIGAELRDAGVRAIFPSVSKFHERFVPHERVKILRAACEELGIVYELNFFASNDSAADAHLRESMGLDDDVYFFDGLTTSGNEEATMQELRTIYRARTPDELDDCGSVHLGVNPHGQVVATCNMTYDNRRYAGTPLFVGDLREEPFERILEREREDAVLRFIYENPHPAIHEILGNDPVVGDRYRDTIATRGYHTVVDYYVDVFSDPVLLERLRSLVPVPA